MIKCFLVGNTHHTLLIICSYFTVQRIKMEIPIQSSYANPNRMPGPSKLIYPGGRAFEKKGIY